MVNVFKNDTVIIREKVKCVETRRNNKLIYKHNINNYVPGENGLNRLHSNFRVTAKVTKMFQGFFFIM